MFVGFIMAVIAFAILFALVGPIWTVVTFIILFVFILSVHLSEKKKNAKVDKS